MSFRLKNVTFRYEPSRDGAAEARNALALQDVTAELPAGEVVAVLGPSGCGKTTLLNLLALLWEGEFDGHAVYLEGDEELDYRDLNRDPGLRARLRRERFGVVLQNCYLLPHFSNLQNVSLPLALLGWDEPQRQAWADAMIREVDARVSSAQDLWDARGGMPRQVSLGQKQRMAVLRAVIHNPRVVFADEPISNLDRANTRAVLQLLLDWQRGRLHGGCAARLLDSGAALPPGLAERLHGWRQAEGVPHTLILVCHHLDIAKACADRALLFDAEHRLVGAFTPERWAELDAQLDRVLKSEPFERLPR